MSQVTPPQSIGKPATEYYKTWVQTERSVHEAWAHLMKKSPRAAMLLHLLVARTGEQNAVVVSQKTISKLMGCGISTAKRAIKDLTAGKWIQVVQLNGPGTVSAYVLNDQVAWAETRDKLHLSMFSAVIIADIEDQDPAQLEATKLRKIPVLYPGEQQLPSGSSDDPPSQGLIPGLEPPLPAKQ